MASCENTCVKFRGYVEADNDMRSVENVDDDNDDEDEQHQAAFDSQEMEALADGNTHIAAGRLKRQKVCLRSLDSDPAATCKVEGQLMYTDPWWELMVQTKPSDGRTHKKIIAPIKYRLRSDDKLDQGDGGSVMYQFLHKCGIVDEHKTNFMEYLRCQADQKRQKVDFALLVNVIEDPNITKTICNLVRKVLQKSVHYHIVKNAKDCPKLLENLPALLPKHLPSLLEDTERHNELKKLEQVIQKKPYLFGFSHQILQETKLHLPEVRYDTFEKARFLQGMKKKMWDALYIYNALKENCARYGNTYYWRKTKYSVEFIHPKCKQKRDISSSRMRTVLHFLKNEMEVIETDEGINPNGSKEKRVFLCKYYWAELNIATKIKELMRNKRHVQLGHYQQDKRDLENFKGDMDQHTAAKSIRQNPFTLIIGRGGCGKTHVVCEVMKEYHGASIVMAAPTGKTASNLRKKFENNCANMKASTLHQIVYSSYRMAQRPDEWEYKDTDILVVDECSMVSVVLLSRALNILLKKSKLKKLVLMGDYRQLPSIEPGNLLQDLFDFFKDKSICVELKTNHRADSGHFVDCAMKISNGVMPDLTADEFHLIQMEENASVEQQKAILEKLGNGDAKDHETSQFVAYTRANCNTLNDWCCFLYTGHEHKKDDQKTFLFLPGDKVCPTRNAFVTDINMKEKYEADNRQQERERRRQEQANQQGRMEGDGTQEEGQKKTLPPYLRRICNGEIFFIKQVLESIEFNGEKKEVVTLTDGNETFDVHLSELRNQSTMRHAWARTIHTYQGSEAAVIIYWLGDLLNQTRQHVYTAVTRGKNKVTIVGTKDNLQQAISREPRVRYTVLQERLKDIGIPVQPADGLPSRRRRSRPRFSMDTKQETMKPSTWKSHESSTLQPSTLGYTSLNTENQHDHIHDPNQPSTSRNTREEKCKQPPKPVSITGVQDSAPINKSGNIQQGSSVAVISSKGKGTSNFKMEGPLDCNDPSTSTNKLECSQHDSGTHHMICDETTLDDDSERMSEDWSEEKIQLLDQIEEAAPEQQGKELNRGKHMPSKSPSTACENGVQSLVKQCESKATSKQELDSGDDPTEMDHSSVEANSSIVLHNHSNANASTASVMKRPCSNSKNPNKTKFPTKHRKQ